MSYEATAALFTVSQQHPAIVGCMALYPFWDAFQDINMPGGIHHHKFLTGEQGMLAPTMSVILSSMQMQAGCYMSQRQLKRSS